MNKKRCTLLALAAAALGGCASLPPELEGRRSFTQESALPYQQAYRIIARQMRACHRYIGLLGNGYDVQADLDGETRTGTVAVYPVGLAGTLKPEEWAFSQSVTIAAAPAGSLITVSGTTPAHVYRTHRKIPLWLGGAEACAPE